jgi:hypothetical protein
MDVDWRAHRRFVPVQGRSVNVVELFARRAWRALLRRIVLAGVAAHPELLPWPLVSEQVAGAGRPGFMPALRAMAGYPLRHRLAQIACPALIVWGARDRVVPVRDRGRVQQLIPDARKVVYPDHWTCSDARAAGAVQCRSAGVSGGGAGVGGGGWAGAGRRWPSRLVVAGARGGRRARWQARAVAGARGGRRARRAARGTWSAT